MIVVDAEGVEGRADGLEVGCRHRLLPARHRRGVHRPEVLDDVGRIRASEDGIEEPAIELSVDAAGGVDVGRLRRIRGVGDGEVQGHAQGQARIALAQLAHGPPVGEQEVMGREHPVADVEPARRVDAGRVGEEGRAPGLVQRRPVMHPVAEGVVHGQGVLGEAVDGLAHRPAAALLLRLRHVPVVEGQPGDDVGRQQLIDQALIEVHPRRVDGAGIRPHAGPRRREPVGLQADPLHQGDVVPIAVIVVAGDIAVVGVDHRARHPAEGVPDRGGAPVLERRALDLEGGGGTPEEEVLGEGTRCALRHGSDLLCIEVFHRQPFTAPAMMPLTSCLPAKTNSSSRGTVARSTPARTIDQSTK